MTTTGTCQLCGKDAVLEESHIVPKFVIRHQKKTSATGYMRSNKAVNLRAQDGHKEHMLCGACEDLFNEWETPFSNHIYYPWASDQKHQSLCELSYGAWMLKFAVSVSWRALTWYMKKASDEQVSFSKEMVAEIDKALSTWKRFLLGELPHPDKYQQHMILLDAIERTTYDSDVLPSNLNRFLTRGIYINLAHSDGKPQFIYTKMGKVSLLGFIGIKYPRQWVGTKLHVKEGVVGGDISLPSQFMDYLIELAKTVPELQKKLSERQIDVIKRTIDGNQDRASTSETYRMMAADIDMFGESRVFSK